MKVDHLYYFKHLAEVLNYTKASQDLFIAQPTLSAAIKRMETELGFTLFQRNAGGGVSLTECGKTFYDSICLSLKHYEAGIRNAREKLGEIDSTLNLGTIYAIQGKFFSQALDAFKADYAPNLQINIRQAFSVELIKMLKHGEIDACFASKLPGGDALQYTPCWSQPLVVGVNKRHPLAERKSISLAELREYDLLTYRLDSAVGTEISELVRKHNLTAYFGYEDEVTLSSLVSSNPDKMALFCYSFLIGAFEEVVWIPIIDVPADFHQTYLVCRNEPHTESVAKFIEFMKKYRFPNFFELEK